MKRSVGLGLRHSFHNYVLENKPQVPWFEVITENYLRFDGKPKNFLREVRKNYPLAFHGVSLSIGSREPARLDYLTLLKTMVDEFQPLWISDHLCWTYHGVENSHDLLPMPFTTEALARTVEKTLKVQDFLGQKIYLENPSAYIDFAGNDFSEEDFISELCAQSGCGLLLDLNNLIVNQYNLGYQPKHYLEKIKNCDVRQIHLAGHTIKEKVRIDTHDTDISPEVLDLLPLAQKYWPDVNPMIEWDDKIPPIEYLLAQREKIQIKCEQPKPQFNEIYVNDSVVKTIDTRTNSIKSDGEKQHFFWKLLKQEDPVTIAEVQPLNLFVQDAPTPAHIGMKVYNSAYYNRLVDVLEKDFPVLRIALDELFYDVALAYIKHHPSVYDSIDFSGTNFGKFISEHNFDYTLGVDQRIISDIANFEFLNGMNFVLQDEKNQSLSVQSWDEQDWINNNLKIKSNIKILKAYCQVHSVIESVQNQGPLELPVLDVSYYVFNRESNNAFYKKISEEDFYFLKKFKEFQNFVELFGADDLKMQQALTTLLKNQNLFCFRKS